YVHETERLVRAVEQTGTTLQVGLNRRFYTSIQAGRAAILATGPVLTINVDASEDGAHIWTDPRLVLASRKRRIFTNSIHPLDLLRYFGGDVREVVSFVDRYVHPAPDCFTAWIKFQSGATGRAAVDHFATRGGNWGFQVRTAEATLTSYDGYLRVVFERRGKEPVEFGLTGDDLRFKPGFPGETRAFLDLVRTGGQPRFPAVSIQDALLTMRLIDSIAQSPAP
ncbi:MAG: Gfo/Idh/MocA family oxidoreductase, partial [Actinobacteria bacterium]|nr:Gfo/Idh/MocA family oxidoreductase [Actinomycetota bacterium]